MHLGVGDIVDTPGKRSWKRQAWKRESLQGQRQRQIRFAGLERQEEEPEGEREQDTLEEALKIARKARDSFAKTQNDLEEALEKAKDKLSSQATLQQLVWARSWKSSDTAQGLFGRQKEKAPIRSQNLAGGSTKVLGNKAASVPSRRSK